MLAFVLLLSVENKGNSYEIKFHFILAYFSFSRRSEIGMIYKDILIIKSINKIGFFRGGAVYVGDSIWGTLFWDYFVKYWLLYF